jgi:hypothetical protein
VKVPAILVMLLLSLIYVNHAYAQEPIVMEQVTTDGSVKVRLVWPEVLPDEPSSFQIMFLDPDSNEPLTDTVWYIVNVRHPAYEEPIEHYEGSVLNGEKSFAVLFPEDATGPVQVVVLILGIADKRTGYDVVFNVHVVPEFPYYSIVLIASIGTALLLARLKMRLLKSLVSTSRILL